MGQFMDQGKKRKIAISLNALVMPGAGHYYMGYKLRGTLLALACLIFMILPIIKYTMLISYTLDMLDLTDNLTAFGAMAQALTLAWSDMKALAYLALLGILFVWIIGMIDIVLITRRK